eukprot:NODE_9720_length_569_cov_17.766816_g9083_i0.p1 GENE.NODE_9720_length_569_cov_17.766816_g9083_i0~~NODE_9720_length_569_cov_17.766816_g9083_i0.p1  ORF type:complete len:105 (+),score=12.21 NODE_9720_length_569_cov_17.766816_g9083_i0:64-378(+)
MEDKNLETDDVCLDYFTRGFCSTCPYLHNMDDLNKNYWIVLPNTRIQITDYLSPKYLSNIRYVECHSQESTLVLLRFPSIKEAIEFKVTYWQYFNPLLLSEIIN